MAKNPPPEGWLEDFVGEGFGSNKSIGIIFLHGFTGSPASMRPWAHYFQELGYSVRVPLIPGHGRDWRDLNETSWEQWPKKVEQVLAPMIAYCERVFIFGLSMGGANTLHVVAKNNSEKIAGIVLVNPMAHIPGIRIKFAPIIAKFIKGLPAIGDDIKKPGVDEFGYDRLPTRGVLELNKFLKETRKLLGRVKVPMQIFHSVEDHVLPVSNTEIIFNEVSSEDKTRIELTNSYHVATLDYDADIIFENSRIFVERIINLGK